MLRILCLIPVLSACGASIGDNTAVSVRDRLTGEPTALAVTPDSAGHLTVRRRVLDGWQTGAVDLVITGGTALLSADESGTVSVDQLDVAIAALDLPLGDTSMQLVDIHAGLQFGTPMDSVWTDDNAVDLSTITDLRGQWSLLVDGRAHPLGDLRLPAMRFDGTLTGDATRVDAVITIEGSGTVWSWADLVEIADLSLTVGATTTAP